MIDRHIHRRLLELGITSADCVSIVDHNSLGYTVLIKGAMFAVSEEVMFEIRKMVGGKN